MKKLLFIFIISISTSCLNYDDDIKKLNDEIDVLKENNLAQDRRFNEEIDAIKKQQVDDANNLKNRLDILEQSSSGIDEIISTLQASNTLLNDELTSIKDDLSSLTTDVSSLTTNVSSITTSQSISSTQASINTLDGQVSQLTGNLTAALNRISTLESSNNSGSSTVTTYTLTETIQLKIDWIAYFTPYGVNDSGWLQRMGSGNPGSLSEQGGLTVLFNHTSNEVNIPNLPQYSFPQGEQFRVEDENGNKVELLRTGSNWKATISNTANRIRFLYKYNSSPIQLFITPYIEIKPSYNKFFVDFKGDITYSNITDTW